jgi:hypothetical protein
VEGRSTHRVFLLGYVRRPALRFSRTARPAPRHISSYRSVHLPPNAGFCLGGSTRSVLCWCAQTGNSFTSLARRAIDDRATRGTAKEPHPSVGAPLRGWQTALRDRGVSQRISGEPTLSFYNSMLLRGRWVIRIPLWPSCLFCGATFLTFILLRDLLDKTLSYVGRGSRSLEISRERQRSLEISTNL